MTTGPTSHRFLSQRLQLRYSDWGNSDAPLLVLQHGGRDHSRSWDQVAEALSEDWHVICPDMRGHGDSDWSPEGNYRMDALVYDFAQLVHTLTDAPSDGGPHQQVTIIAHSLGGSVATRFTGLYPEKVSRFVNIEGLGEPPYVRRQREKPVGERLRQWIEEKREAAARQPRNYAALSDAYLRMKEQNGFLTDEQARHLTIHGTNRNEDGSWSWKFDPYLHIWDPSDLPAHDIETLWRTVTCPLLLMWGKDSWAISPRDDGRLEHFANARLIEYENAGHWLHHDQFDRFIADVKEFLAEGQVKDGG